ncbi:hypothetical protein EJD97_004695, partial [Solanum chilense]
VIEEVTKYKKLNIYKHVSVADKTQVLSVMSAKDIRIEYGIHVFTGQDFRNMTSIEVLWKDWILLHEGRVNVYDCNLMITEHVKFLTLIQPVFELLSKLLMQSGIMNHLPEKLLTQPWEFKGRVEPIVQNRTGAACESYFLAFIEHLISRTDLEPPKTLLCDNLI